ncbi:9307_t:CDS:2, partial [Ambispora leptoticha]
AAASITVQAIDNKDSSIMLETFSSSNSNGINMNNQQMQIVNGNAKVTHDHLNQRQKNAYHRKIDPEKVEFLDERLKDNSFLAKDGAIGSYGHKAHIDFSVARGKNFRAQKTKKKR